MQSLLRTRPENLDDLTIQVALVRPGPIQGGAVHPYIERRQRLREDPSYVPPVDHPSARGAAPRDARRRRLPGPGARGGDGARRLHRRGGRGAAPGDEPQAERGGDRGASARASSPARWHRASTASSANTIYDKLAGFSGFGFPKSHSAAFALLAYQSAWLRHHYPAEFLCALLNAQPMGFYPPASLVRDGAAARGGGAAAGRQPASAAKAARSRTARSGSGSATSARSARRRRRRSSPGSRTPTSPTWRAARRSNRAALEALVASRRVRPLRAAPRAALASSVSSPRPRAWLGRGDSSSRSRSSRRRRYPSCPSRPTGSGCSPTTARRASRSECTRSSSCARICRRGRSRTRELPEHPAGEVAVAGMAVARQRPATANGVVFMLLEDELGQVNLIVPPPVYEQHRAARPRRAAARSRSGRFERVGRQPERPGPRAGDARPAGARGRRPGRGQARAPARAPLRSPLSR